MTHKILVIDDDKDLCTLIKKYGEQNGYTVQLAYTGSQGLLRAQADNFQLIILDIMLPEINGFSVLSEIRKSDTTPILMLTAKDSESDKVLGLKMGADDYLTKPFSMNELLARIESLVRRYTLLNNAIPPTKPIIHLRGMTVDAEKRAVYLNGATINLTAKEFDMLYFFATNAGRIFTKKQLYMQVWDEDYAFDDSNIMSFISKLRKKIEPDAVNPFYIQTIRGVGYRFNQGADL